MSTYIIIFSKLSVLNEYHNHVFSFFFLFFSSETHRGYGEVVSVSKSQLWISTEDAQLWTFAGLISYQHCRLPLAFAPIRYSEVFSTAVVFFYILHRGCFSSFWSKHKVKHKTQLQTYNVTNIWHLHLNILVRAPPERRNEWAFNQILNQTGCDAEGYINPPVNRSPTVMLFD